MDQATIDNALKQVNALTHGIAAAQAVGAFNPSVTGAQKMAGALQVAAAVCPEILPQAAGTIALAQAIFNLFHMFGIFSSASHSAPAPVAPVVEPSAEPAP